MLIPALILATLAVLAGTAFSLIGVIGFIRLGGSPDPALDSRRADCIPCPRFNGLADRYQAPQADSERPGSARK
jgi:hypothetical protein